MKNLQKGSAVPYLIAIIALLIMVGGFYFYSQNSLISRLENSQQDSRDDIEPSVDTTDKQNSTSGLIEDVNKPQFSNIDTPSSTEPTTTTPKSQATNLINPTIIEDNIVSPRNVYDSVIIDSKPNESQYLPTGAEKLAERGDTLIYHVSEWDTYPVGDKLYRIYAVNLSTGKTTELSALNYNSIFNSWIHLSPDGKKIARLLQNDSVNRIDLLSVNNPAVINTVAQNKNFRGLAWSNDSSKIVYSTIDDPYSPKPTFQIYFTDLGVIPYNSILVKSYYDMTVQGGIIFKELTSDGKIYLQRIIMTN